MLSIRKFFLLLIPVVVAIFYTKSNSPSSRDKMKSLRPRLLIGNGRRSAILIGATGATGSQVLKKLLASSEWGKVTTFGRRAMEDVEAAPKWSHHVVDFDKDLNVDDEKVVSLFKGHDIVFNCIGTTRGQAGGADPFYKIEVEYTQKIASLASKAGIKQFSVVSAQGANPHQYYVKWIHPLLYVYTLGMKEEVIKAVEPPFQRVSIFRPGMLNRLKEDRTAEIIINRLFGGLRVDDLAAAIVRDAESQSPPEDGTVEEALIYEGNSVILAQSQL